MPPKKKRIAILGATGSIGQQSLQVIDAHPHRFEAVLLSAARSIDQLEADAHSFSVDAVLVEDLQARNTLSTRLKGQHTKVYPPEALAELLNVLNVDLVLVAVVGFAGLSPTLTAIAEGKSVALANKETLVAGGSLVMDAIRKHSVSIYPVDSEHSAIFQCLMGEMPETVDKIILTASGGPFCEVPAHQLQKITPKQALAHPNWSMGPKVSIDSATMMNKGLEVIEAHWLFDLPPERIEVLIHKQSWVHSLVQFVDGSQKAQLGPADMRLPIQLALSYPERLPLKCKPLELADVGGLSFAAPDTDRFPALSLCYAALRKGGNFPCALNAANESAVSAFLEEQLPFSEIVPLVADCLEKITYIAHPSYEELVHTDAQSRKMATELITI